MAGPPDPTQLPPITDEISTTPPPLPGKPPAMARMATVGNMPLEHVEEFDILSAYNRLLREDPDITMPVAAIESLIELLAVSPTSTVFETLDLLERKTAELKAQVPNHISLSAGTDLFKRYLMVTRPKGSAGSRKDDFHSIRRHLIRNGRVFVQRAKASRHTIASIGRPFIRDGATILTNGGSRVVGALLSKAAKSSADAGSVRFRVIYVLSSLSPLAEGYSIVQSLRSRGIPIAVISESAVGYAMGNVDMVMVGAEGVVENGGIISRLGTYQIGLLARAAGKPFYVVAETHKFVRLYPLSQYDIPIHQNILDFKTDEESQEPLLNDLSDPKISEKLEYFDGKPDQDEPLKIVGAVDFTPPSLISALITEIGVLTPSAVSEELIKIWY
ncbi:MAG: translation initiation factor eIF-2B subunit alpha [Trizodia sp. TS-e1964]|nr:MAG: translation initiation factor eIF-2B subunit alpha [Trizodia sp. TS-e1964]